jgi:hypothetical protein
MTPARAPDGGDAGSWPPPALLAAIGAAIVVLGAALLRQAGVPKIDTLWAEDGAVFLRCAYLPDSVGCFGQAYQGYLHVVPRLIAALAAAVPPSAVAATTGLLAALAAAAGAAVAAWSITDATGSRLAGLLGGAALGLVWQAGREVLGNAANVHWVLLAATTVSIVCVWLGGRITRATIVLAVATCLSSAVSPFVPVAAAVALPLRRPRAGTLLIASGIAAVIQVAVELTSSRDLPAGEPIALGELAGFVRREVIRTGFFGDVPLAVGLAVPLLLVAAVIGVAIVAADRRVALAVLLGTGAIVGVGLGICVASIVVNRALNPRYAYLPAALVVAALAVAAGFLARELGRSTPRAQRLAPLVMAGLVVFLGVGFAVSFRLEARASTGPNVPEQITDAAIRCTAGGFATILISPRPASNEWILTVPCSRLVTPLRYVSG